MTRPRPILLAAAAALLVALSCRGDSPAPPEDPAAEGGAAGRAGPDPVRDEALDPDPPAPRPPGVVYRHEIERATARGPGYLMRQLAPEPLRERGVFRGWRIGARFPDEPGLCEDVCDLQVGDVIVAVNGVRVERPEHLTELLAALPKATELRVDRVRGGKGETRVYRIVEE